MSISTTSLLYQFKLQAWKQCIHGLDCEETKKLLLIAVRQSVAINDLPGQIRLQTLEEYIDTLDHNKAKNILLQVIHMHLLKIQNS